MIKINDNMFILEGCLDSGCMEPTKKKVGTGTKALATLKLGENKHLNIYQCENTLCPNYPDAKRRQIEKRG